MIWALAAAAAAVIAFAVALVVQAAGGGAVERRGERAAELAGRVSATSLRLLQATTSLQASARGYMLTRDDSYLSEYQDARERTVRALASVDALATIDETYRREIPAIRDLVQRRLAGNDWRLALFRAGRSAEAVRSLAGNPAALEMAALREHVETLIARARAGEAAVRAERARLSRRYAVDEAGFAALTIVALVIALISLAFERATARRAAAMQASLNQELVAALGSAEEANGAKSRFLAAASHDLRQPLHALALYISALERRLESREAREILASMDSAVRSMTRLFTALLDLARLEAGVLKPEPVDFALSDLLDDVAAQVVEPGQAGASRIRVASTSLKVHSDPDLLEIVLRNLASNAVKHSRGAEVLVGCRRAGDTIRIEVHDTGPGIAPEKVQALFGAFVRGEEAHSAEGVGLGLSIVERIAKLLGHPLAVRSRPGRGSVFSVTVPRAGAGEAPWADHEQLIRLEGVRVLIADDEPLALDAMRRAFQDAGARVETAPSADEALAMATAGFELYVVDLNLGRADGLQVLDAIQAAQGRPIAGLVVTGATTQETLARLRDAGRPWATKPITAGALTLVARQALAGAGRTPAVAH